MDNQTNNNHNMGENKSMCGDKKTCHGFMFCNEHCNYKHMLVRGIILFFIISFSFWLGIQIGEFRGEFRESYSSRYMERDNMMFGNTGYYRSMMYSNKFNNENDGYGYQSNLNNQKNSGTENKQVVPGGMMRINVSQ